MIIFVVIQAIFILISVKIAKSMVKNWKGFAKKMLIGKDSDETICKMIEIAVRTFNGEPVQTELDKYSLEVERDAGKIVKTKVETERTSVIYDGNHKTDEQVINKAWTEKWAVVYNTILVWGVIFYATIIVGLCITLFCTT